VNGNQAHDGAVKLEANLKIDERKLLFRNIFVTLGLWNSHLPEALPIMRSEQSEAFRRYLQAQPKAIAYAQPLSLEEAISSQWIVWAAGVVAFVGLVANLA
jgi:hypothetical protein